MSNIVPFQGFHLPAAAVQRLQQGHSIAKNMIEGVGAPIDILSIKGKNFTEKVNGEPVLTPRPQYEFDVVILDATSNLGKTYYENTFMEGGMDPPDCWSLNGVKPDAGAPKKQSTTCRGCPKNVFGSRISTTPGMPSKGKACADSRRVAVFAAYKLGHDLPPLMLRVPATSLRPLKEYAQNLEKNNVPINGIITRMGFEAGVAHPQLNFAAVRGLSDQEFQWIDYFQRQDEHGNYEDERLVRILEAPMQEEEIDPSELAGQTITNRLQAPQPEPQASAPPPQMPQAQQTYAPPPPVPAPAPVQQAAQANLVFLPDGKVFNPATGQYVEPPKPEEPPDVILILPDGKRFNQTKGAYEPDSIAPTPPPPPHGAVAATPMKAPPGPPQPGQMRGPPPTILGTDLRPVEPQGIPDFVPKHLHSSAAPAPAEEAAQEVPPAPKPRKPRAVPPAADGQAVQQAPAALESLLASLKT
jgi:hypothetical protein